MVAVLKPNLVEIVIFNLIFNKFYKRNTYFTLDAIYFNCLICYAGYIHSCFNWKSRRQLY